MPKNAIEVINTIATCITVVMVVFILTYGCVEVTRLNNETTRTIGYPGDVVNKP